MNKILLIITFFIFSISSVNIFAENYAVIITGSLPTSPPNSNPPMGNYNNNGEAIYEEFWNDTFIMWKTLHNLGFKDGNIFILFGGGEDYNSGPAYPNTYGITDFSAKKQDVQNIFNWLKNGNPNRNIPQLTNNDFLFIYTFGHGGTVGTNSVLSLMDGYIKDTEFAQLVNQLSYSKRVIWMQQCKSGGFINELQNNKTIICTAVKENQNANQADDYRSDGNDVRENEILHGETYYHGEFSYHMFNAANLKTIIGNSLTSPDTDNNGKASISEIFNWEDQKNSIGFPQSETPQYSDLGNIGSNTYVDVPPDVPSNFTKTISNNHPKIMWVNPVINDFEYIEVWRKWNEGSYIGSWELKLNTTNNYYVDNGFVLGGGITGQVFYKVRTKDRGGNFSPFTSEVSFIYSGTTWKITVNNEINDETNKPKKYSLESNYPNPFNPTTNINYQIAEDGLVNLTVYNELGEIVSHLVNEYQPNGNYTVTFDGTNLPSGLYFYRLQSGEFNQVNKMLLIK